MIKIDDDYYIEVADCFILKRDLKRVGKDGDELYKTYGYYNTIENALQDARKRMLMDGIRDKDISLKDVINIIKELNEKFDELLKVVQI